MDTAEIHKEAREWAQLLREIQNDMDDWFNPD
jgi:hypothetical protein